MEEPILKIFVAGSKELKDERMVCRSVCNVLQNKWGTIETRTYEDFSPTLSTIGHQAEYNEYIANETDVAIFIFSGKVGDITRSEFDKARESFANSNRPEIIVYFDNSPEATTPDVVKFKEALDSIGYYYQEYSSLDDLNAKVKDHLTNVLVGRRTGSKWREYGLLKFLGVSGIIVGIWLLLALIGGVGMFVYDRFMDDDDCLEIASKYVEAGRSAEELIYYFPDATFIYNTSTKELDVVSKQNSSSSLDVTVGKIEHATLGVTVSLLLVRLFTVKVKGNAKTMLGYVAVAAASAVGFGVGCVVEQMLFPPQYSAPVEEYLSNSANWEQIAKGRKPNWF